MEMKIFLNIGVLTIHLQRIQRSDVLPKKLIEKNYPVAKVWTINDTIV